jgi:Zn-dependent protease
MKYSLKIATIKGIPVKLHVSFLFIVVLLTVFLSIQTFSVFGMDIGFGDLDMPIALKWILGGLTALILLFTLFLHELS